MTYEEKLRKIKNKEEIVFSEITDGKELFMLVRDGGIETVKHQRKNGHNDTYEIHCTKVIKPVNMKVPLADDYTKTQFNDYIRDLFYKDYNLFELDNECYTISLDPVETWE